MWKGFFILILDSKKYIDINITKSLQAYLLLNIFNMNLPTYIVKYRTLTPYWTRM